MQTLGRSRSIQVRVPVKIFQDTASKKKKLRCCFVNNTSYVSIHIQVHIQSMLNRERPEGHTKVGQGSEEPMSVFT